MANGVDVSFSTGGEHVWRQIGMTGSDHDECVLCGASTGGIGGPGDAEADKPCRGEMHGRRYDSGRTIYQVRFHPFSF